jgi:hypothetical protein
VWGKDSVGILGYKGFADIWYNAIDISKPDAE